MSRIGCENIDVEVMFAEVRRRRQADKDPDSGVARGGGGPDRPGFATWLGDGLSWGDRAARPCSGGLGRVAQLIPGPFPVHSRRNDIPCRWAALFATVASGSAKTSPETVAKKVS